jgi:hypothetical protein
MFQENEEVVDSAETTTTEDYLRDNDSQDESTGEDEATETNEGGEQSKPKETPEQRKARIKRMYEREFGKQDKGSSKEGSKEGEESSKVDGDERYSRLELKTEGVTSKKAQDIVLDYAKYKGIEPLDALKSPIVRAEMAELEKKTSVPAPSSRTNAGSSNDFAYWVTQAKKGNFPRHDRAMMEKLAKARIW